MLKMIFLFFAMSAYSRETDEGNWFQRHYGNKIFLGYYSSYFDDNIKLLQGGYESVLRLITIKPNFNLLNVGIGLNGIMAFDMVEGQERPKNGRTTYGFELNWNIRLFIIPIQKINSGVFIEGCGMSLVVYSREFPDSGIIVGGAKGTHANIGTYAGLGMEYPIQNGCKGFTALRWFHVSNGKVYANNPALNTVGIITGLQF